MGMNVSTSGSDDAEEMVDMNTTPLIDVMLVLLIMLIITIPIQLHSVNLNMPVNSAAAEPPKPPVIIKVTVEPTGAVLWNGAAITTREELEAKLTEVAAMPDQPELHLKPDVKAPYKYVAAVLASAQRLGVNKLGIVGNERFNK